MSETAKTDAEMRYLLGNLTEVEKARLEEDYFADDSKFEAFELAEDDLIDAYIRNELSSPERLQFETNLLSLPRIRERVNFAKALAQKINSIQSPESEAAIESSPSFSSPRTESKTPWWKSIFVAQPAFGMATAALAVLLLVPSAALFAGWFSLRNESERLAAERSELQRQKEVLDKLSADQRTSTEQSRAELQRATDELTEAKRRFEESVQAQKRGANVQSVLGAVTSILLTPGSSRAGGGQQELVHRLGASRAELKLVLENNDYRSYEVTVKTRGSNVAYSGKSPRPRKSGEGPLLILTIPRKNLPPGDYVVEVNGRTSSGKLEKLPSYLFRVLSSK